MFRVREKESLVVRGEERESEMERSWIKGIKTEIEILVVKDLEGEIYWGLGVCKKRETECYGIR